MDTAGGVPKIDQIGGERSSAHSSSPYSRRVRLLEVSSASSFEEAVRLCCLVCLGVGVVAGGFWGPQRRRGRLLPPVRMSKYSLLRCQNFSLGEIRFTVRD